MAGLDSKVLFLLNGESFEDSSYNQIVITNNGMTEAQIVDEEINGHQIKCIDFNTTSYLSFKLDTTFFRRSWTLDWWEKDSGIDNGLSGLFTNIVASSGKNSFGVGANKIGQRNFLNMSSTGTTSYFASTYDIGADIYDEWVHRAIVCDAENGEYRVYVNGYLYSTLKSSEKCYEGYNVFNIGRWRTSAIALNKKVYNLRLSETIRYSEDFIPQVEKYTDTIEGGVVIEDLLEGATLIDISNKIKEIKEANNVLKEMLKANLLKKGVEVDENDTLQRLISKIDYIQ